MAEGKAIQFLRQNTAVIVTVGPFYDKTDGVTPETSLTITNERITLTADTDAGSAPTNILDNVTGATSGTSNDLNYITGNDAGMMQLELSASNTNRVGRMLLAITDAANHVPVFHEYFVLPQAIFDWLTGVVTPLPANVTHWLGTAAATPTVAGVPEVDLTHVGGATTNVAALATNVDAILTDTGTTLQAELDGIQADTEDIQSRLPAALTAGGNIKSDMLALNGGTQSAADLKDFADDGYDPSTNKVQGVVLTDTLTTYTGNTPQTGDSFARLGAPAGASVSADILAVDNLVDDLESRIGTPSDLGGGATVAANLADIEAQTDDIGTAGAGLTAINLPDQTMNITGNITGNLSGSVGSVTGAVGSVTAGVTLAASAIQAIWDALTSALTTVGSIGKLLVDNINATISSRLASASYTTPPTAAANADAVWDETLSDHLTAGSTGNALNAAGAAGDPWSTALPGAYGAGTAGKIIGDNINATISSRATQTSVDTIDDFLDTEIAAIKAKTDNLPSDPADASDIATATNAILADTNAILADTGTDGVVVAAASKTGYRLSATGVDDVLDEVVLGSYTLRQLMRGLAAAELGKLSGAATTEITIRSADDAKDVVIATVDADGNRSAVTLDLS